MSARSIQVFGAFAWIFWTRHRLRYCLGVLALAAILGIMHVAQGGRFMSVVPMLAGLYGLILFGFVYSIAGPTVWSPQALPQMDAATIPKGVTAMPMTDRQLIFAPMLLGILGVSIPWLILVFTTLRPLGITLAMPGLFPSIEPLGFPLAFAWATVGTLVLNQWQIGMRNGMGCLASLGLMLPLFAGFAIFRGVPESVLDPICLGIGVWSLFACLLAAPRARHGIGASPGDVVAQRAVRPGGKKAAEPKIPFPSAWYAQFWYEEGPGRAALWPVPFFLLLFLCLLAALPNWIGSFHRETAISAYSSIGLWDLKISPNGELLVMFSQYVPVGLLLWAGNSVPAILSGDVGLLKKPGLERLTAIRPISTAKIVGAKLVVAAKVALTSMPVLLIWGAAVLNVRAAENSEVSTVGAVIQSHLGSNAGIAAVLAVLALPLATWSLLSGNPLRYYVKLSVLRVVGFGLFIIPSFANLGMLLYREAHPSEASPLAPALWSIVALAISAKLFLGIQGARIIRRENLIPADTFLAGTKIWLATAGVATLDFALTLSAYVSPWTVAAAVVLILPVNRILWQIIGLERSRHGQI